MDIQPYPARLHPLIPSTPTLVRGIDERVGTLTPHQDNLINGVFEDELPVIHPSHSDSTCRITAFPGCTQV
jgi:hypothetical protein